jgi:hypothetical protein
LENTAFEELKEENRAGTWGMKENGSQDEAGELAMAKVLRVTSGTTC